MDDGTFDTTVESYADSGTIKDVKVFEVSGTNVAAIASYLSTKNPDNWIFTDRDDVTQDSGEVADAVLPEVVVNN